MTTAMTLADALAPRRFPLSDTVRIVAGAGLIAVGAQVTIPLPYTPVPMTLQTFSVLLAGFALGWRRGAASASLYLLLGALGAPIFAGGAAGLTKLTGPTAGYLLGFPVAAAICGLLAERGWDRQPLTTALGMSLASLAILVPGTAWLSVCLGSATLGIEKGLLPFWIGDLVKCALAAALLPGAWGLVNGRERSARSGRDAADDTAH